MRGNAPRGPGQRAQEVVLILELVYGCPDCADGGEKSVTLSRDGVLSIHRYEYSSPPSVFVSLDATVFGAAQGLKDCVTSETVLVQGQCPLPLP